MAAGTRGKRRRKPGRPKGSGILPSEKRRSERIQVSVTPGEARVLREQARREGVSVAQLAYWLRAVEPKIISQTDTDWWAGYALGAFQDGREPEEPEDLEDGCGCGCRGANGQFVFLIGLIRKSINEVRTEGTTPLKKKNRLRHVRGWEDMLLEAMWIPATVPDGAGSVSASLVFLQGMAAVPPGWLRSLVIDKRRFARLFPSRRPWENLAPWKVCKGKRLRAATRERFEGNLRDARQSAREEKAEAARLRLLVLDPAKLVREETGCVRADT